jgi:hypothetical protein
LYWAGAFGASLHRCGWAGAFGASLRGDDRAGVMGFGRWLGPSWTGCWVFRWNISKSNWPMRCGTRWDGRTPGPSIFPRDGRGCRCLPGKLGDLPGRPVGLGQAICSAPYATSPDAIWRASGSGSITWTPPVGFSVRMPVHSHPGRRTRPALSATKVVHGSIRDPLKLDGSA